MLVLPIDFLAGSKNKAVLEFLAFVLRQNIYFSLRSKGLVYRFSGYLSEGSIFGKSIFIFEGDSLTDNRDEILENITSEIMKVVNIDENELFRLKNDFCNWISFNSQTPSQKNSQLRIRRFIYDEKTDWRQLIKKISLCDFLNMAKVLEKCYLTTNNFPDAKK